MPAKSPALTSARVLVPQSDGTLLSAGEANGSPIIVTDRAIYLREIVGGPSRVEIYDRDGKRQGKLPLPDIATVNEVVALGDGTLFYDIETYLRPPYFSRYHESGGKSEETRLAQRTHGTHDVLGAGGH